MATSFSSTLVHCCRGVCLMSLEHIKLNKVIHLNLRFRIGLSVTTWMLNGISATLASLWHYTRWAFLLFSDYRAPETEGSGPGSSRTPGNSGRHAAPRRALSPLQGWVSALSVVLCSKKPSFKKYCLLRNRKKKLNNKSNWTTALCTTHDCQ